MNTWIIVVIYTTIGGAIGFGAALVTFDQEIAGYNPLIDNYDQLSRGYNQLVSDSDKLTDDYNKLVGEYNQQRTTHINDYNQISTSYNLLLENCRELANVRSLATEIGSQALRSLIFSFFPIP